MNSGKQKAGPVKRILAGGLNRRAPFMAVYEHPSSKTHIQITSSSLSGSSDIGMMEGRGGKESVVESSGASLIYSVLFSIFPPCVTLTSPFDLSSWFYNLNYVSE